MICMGERGERMTRRYRRHSKAKGRSPFIVAGRERHSDRAQGSDETRLGSIISLGLQLFLLRPLQRSSSTTCLFIFFP